MATTRRNHLTTSQDRSPFILERRRNLFPIDDYDMDSDLGHIGPLCSDTTSDSDDEGVASISDYDIAGIVQNKRVLGNETPTSMRSCSETMSPLKLSPYIKGTPKKFSPSHNLKTPHDTSTKPVLQKEQKVLLEESKSLKRRSSHGSSPERDKNLKSDYKNSKVRTALFPPEKDDTYAPLPAKSFYSRNPLNPLQKLGSKREKYAPKNLKFSTGRSSHVHRKKFGQINNGVRHKIRKPKQKKISKTAIAKAANKMLETGSVLNDYIQDLKELRHKQNTESKLIENPTTLKNNVITTNYQKEQGINGDLNYIKELQATKKLISTPVKQIQSFTEENKENIQTESQHTSVSPLRASSPQDTKSRKFFKSSRAKVSSKPEKIQGSTKYSASKVSSARIETTIDLFQSQEINNKVPLDDRNDFDDEEMESHTDIDNILSVLSDEGPQKLLDVVVDRKEYNNLTQKVCNNRQDVFDLSKSSNEVVNPLPNVTSESMYEKCTADQKKNVEQRQNFENDPQAVFNISQAYYDVLNAQDNPIIQNIYETSEVSGYQFQNTCRDIFDVPELSSDIFGATSQNIDSIQCLEINKNDLNSVSTSSMVNSNVYVDDRGCVVDVNSMSSFAGPQENIDGNLSGMPSAYNNSTLEPCIVSSQVVFDNILLEEENQIGVTALPKQNEPFSSTSSCTNHLEPNNVSNCPNKITLEAHNSVLASENSIQLHQNNVANMILSPISQMCDVTSGLALNSPKRGRKLSPLLNNMSRASKILSFTNCHSADMEQQQKLFPVFYPGAKGTPDRGEKRERGEVKRSAKRFKALHEDQMLLDAGQRKFGYTICNECNIVYHMGDPGDEIEHTNYHNASHILRFGGWKNEHVVADFQKNGRIIKVLPTDSKIWLKKVKDLMDFVKRELGCYEMEYDLSGSQVYLYIKNRTITGCAVATIPKEGGHRMLSAVSGVAVCSEESYPIKCGISHIWVAANFRKQRIATALMEAVKMNFIYGYILTDSDIALTSPTDAGSAFAEKYFKTPNYLIYYT